MGQISAGTSFGAPVDFSGLVLVACIERGCYNHIQLKDFASMKKLEYEEAFVESWVGARCSIYTTPTIFDQMPPDLKASLKDSLPR